MKAKKERHIEWYLLDMNKEMTDAWREEFADTDVKIVTCDFYGFMREYNPDVIVTPGNSYGIMSGGYDLAVRDWFGVKIQEKIQKEIKDEWKGELMPGASVEVWEEWKSGKKIIYIPTMAIPEPMADTEVIYWSMRTALIRVEKALESGGSVVIPAFGAGTGRVPEIIVAQRMREAYRQINENGNEELPADFI